MGSDLDCEAVFNAIPWVDAWADDRSPADARAWLDRRDSDMIVDDCVHLSYAYPICRITVSSTRCR